MNGVRNKLLGMAKARRRLRAFEVAIMICPRTDTRVQSKLENFAPSEEAHYRLK
jgi:hypothetical protein